MPTMFDTPPYRCAGCKTDLGQHGLRYKKTKRAKKAYCTFCALDIKTGLVLEFAKIRPLPMIQEGTYP